MLKRLGYFREMVGGETTDPSVFDCINKGKYKNKKEICNYLRAGEVIAAFGGVPYDIVNNSDTVVEMPHLMTDGVWYWSGDLPYYVEKYDVKLDEEFLAYIGEICNE